MTLQINAPGSHGDLSEETLQRIEAEAARLRDELGTFVGILVVSEGKRIAFATGDGIGTPGEFQKAVEHALPLLLNGLAMHIIQLRNEAKNATKN